jgi:hypothetical protein
MSTILSGIAAVRKLYLPYGGLPRTLRVSRGLPGDGGGVVFHWFCPSRPDGPVAPYATLIQQYASLGAPARARAEAMADEMFTEEEFGLLRDYLFRRHREDLRTAVLTTPVPALKVGTVTRAEMNRPFLPPPVVADGGDEAAAAAPPPPATRVELCAEGFYRLSEEEGCSLPFAVWGHYVAAMPHGRLAGGLHAAHADDGDEDGAVELRAG